MLAAVETKYLFFKIEHRLFALPAAMVERVERSVEINPLPGAPEVIAGAINVAGRILPVYNIKKKMGIPADNIELDDHLIIISTEKRKAALLCDSVEGVMELADSAVDTGEKIYKKPQYVSGLIKAGDGIALISDIENFLTGAEEKDLSESLEKILGSNE